MYRTLGQQSPHPDFFQTCMFFFFDIPFRACFQAAPPGICLPKATRMGYGALRVGCCMSQSRMVCRPRSGRPVTRSCSRLAHEISCFTDTLHAHLERQAVFGTNLLKRFKPQGIKRIGDTQHPRAIRGDGAIPGGPSTITRWAAASARSTYSASSAFAAVSCARNRASSRVSRWVDLKEWTNPLTTNFCVGKRGACSLRCRKLRQQSKPLFHGVQRHQTHTGSG